MNVLSKSARNVGKQRLLSPPLLWPCFQIATIPVEGFFNSDAADVVDSLDREFPKGRREGKSTGRRSTLLALSLGLACPPRRPRIASLHFRRLPPAPLPPPASPPAALLPLALLSAFARPSPPLGLEFTCCTRVRPRRARYGICNTGSQCTLNRSQSA